MPIKPKGEAVAIYNLTDLLKDPARRVRVLGARDDADCFFCGDRIRGEFAAWHGMGTIYLHPDCARELGTHLIKDGMLAQLNERAANQALRVPIDQPDSTTRKKR